MSRNLKRLRRNEKGSALIELSLLAPWILFLFVGIVDMGFYSYALISVENAARVAAEYTSQTSSAAADKATACTMVRAELASLPNVANLSNCDATPLIVTADSVTGPDNSTATSVSVTYQGVGLIPIPGLLIGRLNVTRNVQMRVRS
jgi:Flp pilus assembly protein TadG